MFKPLNVIFLKFLHSKDEAMNRLQTQMGDLILRLQNLQPSFFVVSKFVRIPNQDFKDVLLYQSNQSPITSSNKEELTSPVYPLGFGRKTVGSRIDVSTVIHYSDIIQSGEAYTLDASNKLTPTDDRRSAVLIGLTKGVGIIIHRNLPS